MTFAKHYAALRLLRTKSKEQRIQRAGQKRKRQAPEFSANESSKEERLCQVKPVKFCETSRTTDYSDRGTILTHLNRVYYLVHVVRVCLANFTIFYAISKYDCYLDYWLTVLRSFEGM